MSVSFTSIGYLKCTLTPRQVLLAKLNFGEATIIGNTVFVYMGEVETLEDLPENPENGDTYFVESEESNFAWNGVEWQDIGANTMAEHLTSEEISELQGLLN